MITFARRVSPDEGGQANDNDADMTLQGRPDFVVLGLKMSEIRKQNLKGLDRQTYLVTLHSRFLEGLLCLSLLFLSARPPRVFSASFLDSCTAENI